MKNLSKIISILFLFFSILLLCYVHYRSQIVNENALIDYYIKYYVIAFLCIFFSFISFFIPRKIKINIALVGASVLISLYFIEGYLSIKKYLKVNKDLKEKYLIYKKKTGQDYDKRTLMQVFQEQRIKDPNIAVSIGPNVFLNDKNLNYLPLTGVANQRTIQCNENGYYAFYQSDRYGFNNPDNEWNKDIIDFLLIGDSFTAGACVNEPDTISGNLKKLNNKNANGILNLGQIGSGTLVQYATLREYLEIKKVRRVILIYYEGNDLDDIRTEFKNKILLNYLKDKKFSQNLISKKSDLQTLILNKLETSVKDRDLQKKLNNFTISKFLKLTKIRNISIESFFSTSPLEEFEKILKFSNRLVKKNNSILYFVYLPEHYRYANQINDKNFRNYNEIIKIVKGLGISIIDINKELLNNYDDKLFLFPFRQYAHYNEKGYRLIAETIFRKINELEE
tara:strand:- start:2278 stop:3633 length:1356 start_codon:yes stop_codon:yes gene_type:complete